MSKIQASELKARFGKKSKLPVPAKKINRRYMPHAKRVLEHLSRPDVEIAPDKDWTPADVGYGDKIEADQQEGIPAFLDRKQNGITGPGPVIAVLPSTTAPLSLPEAAKLREAQKAVKKTKTAVRIEKLVAKKSGEAAKMPLTGKAALQAIAKAAVDSGKVKITRIEAKIDRQARKETPAKAPGKANGAKKAKGGRQGTKLEAIVALLKRKGGCTSREVMALCNWPSVSMPQQAKAAGLKLRKVKDGKVTRYFAS